MLSSDAQKTSLRLPHADSLIGQAGIHRERERERERERRRERERECERES